MQAVELLIGFYTSTIKYIFIRLSTSLNEKSIRELELGKQLAFITDAHDIHFLPPHHQTAF